MKNNLTALTLGMACATLLLIPLIADAAGDFTNQDPVDITAGFGS